jgi:O-antigen/teichoic acid export membrane protein
MLPAFSRVQEDSKRLARVYLSVFGLLAFLLLPPFCAMAAAPGVVILGLYGAKWAAAVPLFQPLALALPLYGLMGLSGPTLAARGKPRIELMIQLPIVLIALLVFSISIHFSVLCLSWCVLGVYTLRFASMTHAVLHELGADWRDVVRVGWPGLVLAGIAAVAAFGIDSILSVTSMTARLAIVAAGVAIIMLIVVVTGRRLLLTPILRDTPQIRGLLFSRFKFLVRR